jgi:micrococcal nuclease
MNKTIKVFLYIFLTAALPLVSIGQTKIELKDFKGKVIKIVDGDTYDVLTKDYKTIRIRMNGIDAPEKKQAFGQKSKDYLGSLCFGKEVQIKPKNYDRNKRLIADSFTASGKDLSREMVRAGYAWHFKKYSSDKILAADENHARALRAGLWVDNEPVAPWTYRSKR